MASLEDIFTAIGEFLGGMFAAIWEAFDRIWTAQIDFVLWASVIGGFVAIIMVAALALGVSLGVWERWGKDLAKRLGRAVARMKKRNR